LINGMLRVMEYLMINISKQKRRIKIRSSFMSQYLINLHPQYLKKVLKKIRKLKIKIKKKKMR
jgi:hypothetical protein